jgi:hypothetical protein
VSIRQLNETITYLSQFWILKIQNFQIQILSCYSASGIGGNGSKTISRYWPLNKKGDRRDRLQTFHGDFPEDAGSEVPKFSKHMVAGMMSPEYSIIFNLEYLLGLQDSVEGGNHTMLIRLVETVQGVMSAQVRRHDSPACYSWFE